MNKIIISTQGDSTRQCLDEIKSIHKGFKLIKWLDRGIGVGEIDISFIEFSNLLKENKPVYLRHIFQVEDEVNFSEEILGNLIEEYATKIDIAKTYAIQGYTIVSKYGKKEINDIIVEKLREKGYVCNNQYPNQVISYILFKDTLYIGFGFAENNLSNWTLGMRRYQKYQNQISRAEFKLLEVIENFNIDLSNYEKALDLGSAPGGWTKVLLEKGLHVTAVDPAKLELKHNNLSHYKGLAEDFVKKNNETFDLIVNDMKMDVCDTAKIMVNMVSSLSDKGIAIVTYKLPKNKSVGKILDGDRIIKEAYEIIEKKQLFYNRNEITLVLEKKQI